MQRWDGIDEFVAVATMGSFAAGAQHLNASTSQVSRAIARLESHIKAQLFFRTTRKVTLTDTGRDLVERCRHLIQQRDEALDLVSGGDEPQGELRLTCSTAIGTRFVAPIVGRMARQFPKLSINLELSNRVIDLVAEGFDLAIRTGHLPDSRLIATRVALRRFYLCASPDYLEREGRPDILEDLATHECLIGNSTTWHFHFQGEDRLFRPIGRWRCNSGDAVLEAALAGSGICQLPEFYVLDHVAAGRLEILLDHLRPDDEPIWAVYPQRKHLLPKVRFLVEKLRRELPSVINIQAASADHGA